MLIRIAPKNISGVEFLAPSSRIQFFLLKMKENKKMKNKTQKNPVREMALTVQSLSFFRSQCFISFRFFGAEIFFCLGPLLLLLSAEVLPYARIPPP